jgi:hypothetical protein
MQRPYKYASLVNPVCLTDTCSVATPEPATDIIQEAQRSISDEFQVALQTNNPTALQSYLEKYPESPERQKAVSEIARLKRSDFSEWTLYGVSNGRFPQYLKLSSIHQFGDRVAIQIRGLADPSAPLIGPTKFPDGTYDEYTGVLDCKQSVSAIAERKAVSPSGEILGNYKWADPEVLNLSGAFKVEAPYFKNLLCDERLRTPLVSKNQLASMDFSYLSPTSDPDGAIYYQPLQNEGESQTEKDVVVLIKFAKDRKVAEQAAPGSSVELGNFSTTVNLDRISCEEKKVFVLKTEYFDASNALRYIYVANAKTWSEFEEGSPLELLQGIVCHKTFGGLGVRLAQNSGATTVTEVFGGSPAEKAGVKANDTIAAIDNEPVSGLTLQQITEKARGPADTKVVLRILREGQTSPMELTVTRGNIPVQSMQAGAASK